MQIVKEYTKFLYAVRYQFLTDSDIRITEISSLFLGFPECIFRMIYEINGRLSTMKPTMTTGSIGWEGTNKTPETVPISGQDGKPEAKLNPWIIYND